MGRSGEEGWGGRVGRRGGEEGWGGGVGRRGGEQDAEKDKTTEGAVTPRVLSCSSSSIVGVFRESSVFLTAVSLAIVTKKQQQNSNKTRTTNAKYHYCHHTIENILMVKKNAPI